MLARNTTIAPGIAKSHQGYRKARASQDQQIWQNSEPIDIQLYYSRRLLAQFDPLWLCWYGDVTTLL